MTYKTYLFLQVHIILSLRFFPEFMNNADYIRTSTQEYLIVLDAASESTDQLEHQRSIIIVLVNHFLDNIINTFVTFKILASLNRPRGSRL